MIAALLRMLLACDPAPPPVVAPPPAPELKARRPLPEACVKRLGVLAQQLSLALDAGLQQSLSRDWTPETERKLGEQVLATTLAASPPLHPKWDSVAEATLARLDAAFPEARFPHQVEVLDSPQPNAFALPGGAVILHAGLIEQHVQDEAQLAFVIAHELAHVELGHAAALHRYLQALPAEQRVEGQAWLELARGGFSTTQELEADRMAVVLMHLAGFDAERAAALWRQPWPAPEGPTALAELLLPELARLESAEGQELLRQLADSAGTTLDELAPDGLEAAVLPLLASHPPPEVRACVCEDSAQWVARSVPLEAPGDLGVSPWPPP